MKILACVSRFYPYKYPTAKHAQRILSFLKGNGCDITVLSLGKSKASFIDDGIEIFEYPDYRFESFDKPILKLNKLIYKCCNFFTRLFGFNFSLDSHFLKKQGKKVLKKSKDSFDLIFSFSGSFSAHETSCYLAKKYSLPVFLFYSDPFYSLYRGLKKKVAFKKDKKWFDSAVTVFMPQNYYPQYCQFELGTKKIKITELAGCFSTRELRIINSIHESDNIVLYAGGFDKKYRNPETFFKIVEYCNKLKFIVLGDKNSDIYKNVSYPNFVVKQRLSGDEFLKEIGEAKILYLEDNLNTPQIPFKTFEYLSTGKKIMFCTSDVCSNTSELIKKYPNSIIVNKSNINFNEIINFLELDNKNTNNYEKMLNEYMADTIGKKVLGSIKGLKYEN